jgi:hypothetical protein
MTTGSQPSAAPTEKHFNPHRWGESLTGSKRDLAFSVVHLVEMANAMVERSLR